MGLSITITNWACRCPFYTFYICIICFILAPLLFSVDRHENWDRKLSTKKRVMPDVPKNVTKGYHYVSKNVTKGYDYVSKNVTKWQRLRMKNKLHNLVASWFLVKKIVRNLYPADLSLPIFTESTVVLWFTLLRVWTISSLQDFDIFLL